ncbi:putative proline utilization protein PrnX [Aspergillus saccharolyticus JOP 1030-1]|uniref:Ornithine cyclodeaminase/mu-crystallin family protein n=1 Tax=Aspergillus saccharolyticus JOP 1030-1 TaxID=1450539 RepID=A0A318ZA65_9EURO|nr:ornithine cyclodeaminase/mu-crystallin family protein [Aspergillus saccharolyticus JOP 1030-1]PYH44159.1 ornithine cyclodeaminase/mu-crystallin family protein [Aspergillus saccharolyticus JOP 1030-1]
MRILAEPDVSKILRELDQPQCHDFLDALCDSLTAVSNQSILPETEHRIHQPLRSTILTKEQNLSLFMPVSNTVSTGIKIVTASQSHGLIGVINIFSPEGSLQGLLSAAKITAFRTALTIMSLLVRCKSLSKENVVILGSGRQAEWHARLVLLLFPEHVRSITILNRGRRRLEELEQEVLGALRTRYPHVSITTVAKDAVGTDTWEEKLQAALQACDVLFSCTPATEPNFPASYLQPFRQRFISLIGSYKPHMREVDTETLLSGGGKVYVDLKEACLEESGELILAEMKEEQLIEVGELYGKLKGAPVEVPQSCNVIFKCVGMGIMDLVIGNKLLDVGRERGIGMEVDGF